MHLENYFRGWIKVIIVNIGLCGNNALIKLSKSEVEINGPLYIFVYNLSVTWIGHYKEKMMRSYNEASNLIYGAQFKSG